jgi:hypothetical protein
VTLGRFSMARFFPGDRISQIHGTARMVNGRLCVAMYHPAAGLHQASLADVIRDDFRKLPAFLQLARLLKRPSTAELKTQVTHAEGAMTGVVEKAGKAKVLEQPTAYETEGSTAEAQMPPQTEQSVGEPATPPAQRSRDKKSKEQSESYMQMSFLDP